MEGVDALNSGLYFNAAQAAANEAAKQAQQKKKAEKTKKSAFSSAFEKAQAEHQLISEGLPAEIAGMSPEEAVVYLKDAADIVAEKLKASQMPENFADYRKKVSQFMKYIVKNNFEVIHHSRAPKRGRKMAPQTQIVVINQKLDEMAQWLLHSHTDTLQMLAKIEEVSGLLVDLMAT